MRRQPLLDGAAALRVRQVLYLNGLHEAEIEDTMQEIELMARSRPASATRFAFAVGSCYFDNVITRWSGSSRHPPDQHPPPAKWATCSSPEAGAKG